jgi:hypothetical protein
MIAMLGFLVGTLCLIGLIKTLRAGRGCGGRGYGGGCGGGGWGRRRWGRGGPGAWGGGGWDHDHDDDGGFGGPAVFLRGVFRHLETTPGQEKVIGQAIDELRAAGRKARGEARASRADLAKAMRSPAVDEVLFGEMFARHDTALEELRKAAIGSLAKVHDALDEQQRARVAEMIEAGPGFFRRGPFGPSAYV